MTNNRVSTTGPHTVWSPTTRANIDRLMTWGLLWTGFLAMTCALAFVLVPVELRWTHYFVASLFLIKGLVLMRIAFKLISLVIKGKGRRRAT